MKALFLFIISISIVYSLSAQENCANALTLTPGNQQCGNSTGQSGDFPESGAAPSNMCDVEYNDDEYWFEYTAASTENLTLTLSSISNTYAGLFVLDDCPVGEPICVASGVNEFETTDIIFNTGPLVVGTSYKIVIANWGLPNNTAFCLDAVIVPIGTNDECVNATPIVCDDNFISESTAGSTDNGDDTGCDMGAGVWYEFQGIDGLVTLSVQAGAGFDHEIAVASSADCITFVNVACADSGVEGGLEVIAFNSELGTTYYFYVGHYSSALIFGEFDISVSCPDNGECVNATPIVCDDNFISESTAGSANGDDTGCNMGAGVWYEFQGIDGLVTLSVQAGAGFDHAIAVASSADCITFVNVACADSGVEGDLEEITFNSELGTTYYFYVGHWSSAVVFGEFDISVSCVIFPSNDDCDVALPVIVEESFSCGNMTPGTLVNATASPEDNTACVGSDEDVWFSFMATATEHRIELLNVANGTTDLYHSVWQGTCGGLTLVPGSCSVIEESNVSGLTIGNTYYLRVYSGGNEPQITTFDVCIRSVSPPPTNDNCGGAIPVTVKLDLLCESTTQGTTESATASPEDDTSCPAPAANDDVWFSFIAKATEHIIDLQNVANGNGTTNLYHSVWEGTCGGLTLVSGSCSDPEMSTISGLAIGNTYYLRVYSWTFTNGQSITFDVCIGTTVAPPANDECVNATPIACDDNFISETTINASDNGDAMGCSIGAGVWYEFQGVDGEVTLTVSPVIGFDHEIAVASSSDCITFVNVDCEDTAISGEVEAITFTAVSTKTYYFYVGHYSSATIFGSFDIAVSCVLPPINDDCATASVLAMNTTGSLINQTFAGATGSGKPAEACDVDSTPTPADVWYSIDTDADGGNLIVIVEPGPNSDIVVAIYNACGDAVPEQCVDLGGNGGIETINFAANFKDDKGNVSTTRDADYFVRVYEKVASGEPFEIGAQGAALPIVLGSFEAKAEKRENRVEWSTLSEINSDYVEVQSSPNGSTKWEPIGKVQTKGESLSKLHYELFDNNPYEVTYYRLNAVDKDGKAELSHTINVKREDRLGRMSLSPNPTSSSISLQTVSTTDETGTVTVYEMTGKIVMSESINLRNGLNTYSIDLNELNTGIYLFSLQTLEGVQVEKIVKQ
ncbi:MAG: hypothetical protein ACJATI_000611 [Halioglobus sp.]|jgi:hypothetical protein